jgi:hypothetical protein
MVSSPTKKTDRFYELIQMRIDPLGRRHERIALEEKWLTDYGYYRGKTNFDIVGQWQFRDRFQPGPRHRVPYAINMIRTDVVRAVAMLLSMNIDQEVIPANDDYRSKEIADVSGHVLQHIDDAINWNRVTLLSTLSAAIYGLGIIRLDWNKSAGQPERLYMTNKTSPEYIPAHVLSPEQKREFEKLGLFKDFPQGEIDARNTSPFSFYTDWSSRDAGIKGCLWAGEKHLVDVSVAAEMLGVDEEDIPVTSDDRGGRYYEEAVAYMSANRGFGARSWSEPEEKRGKRTMLVDMWQRPNREYKRGFRAINCGGRTFYEGDNPNIADQTGLTHLPWLIQPWIPNPGDFYPSGLVEDQRGAQWHLNECRTAMSSYVRVYGNPPIFISKASGINLDKVSIHPGGVYAANENSWVVKPGPSVTLPPEVFGFAQICQQDLAKIASQSDIDGSKLPGQLRSAPALRAIAEERHIALNIPAQSLVEMQRDAGRMKLILYQQHVDSERLARYQGDDGQYATQAFTGADLTNDLVVIGTPRIEDTAATREASVLDEIQAGLLNPQDPQDKRLAFRRMRYHTKNDIEARAIQAEKNEEYEYELMVADPHKYAAGIGPDGNILGGYPVQTWEDHQAALDCLRSLMYRERFKRLDPLAQALVTDHYEKHAALLEQQQVKAMQFAEATKGAPGEKGVASQPKA